MYVTCFSIGREYHRVSTTPSIAFNMLNTPRNSVSRWISYICPQCRSNTPGDTLRRGLKPSSTSSISPPRSRSYHTPATNSSAPPSLRPHRPPTQGPTLATISSTDVPLPPPSAYASYISTTPPTPAQLAYASRFFTRAQPSFLFSTVKFRELPISSVPEVAFIGRSNVGKSSLLNALLHRTGTKIANVSGKPGRTRAMNAFGVGGEDGGVRSVGGPVRGQRKEEAERGEEGERERWIGRGGLVVLDMPGYGKASREEWGKEIMKYLNGRKQYVRCSPSISCAP